MYLLHVFFHLATFNIALLKFQSTELINLLFFCNTIRVVHQIYIKFNMHEPRFILKQLKKMIENQVQKLATSHGYKVLLTFRTSLELIISSYKNSQR